MNLHEKQLQEQSREDNTQEIYKTPSLRNGRKHLQSFMFPQQHKNAACTQTNALISPRLAISEAEQSSTFFAEFAKFFGENWGRKHRFYFFKIFSILEDFLAVLKKL